MFKFRKINYLWISLIWAATVFMLSTTSGDNFKELSKINIQHLDKFVHFVMYLLLTFFLVNGFRQLKNQNIFSRFPLIITFLIAVSYGGFIELIQEHVFISRSMDIYDFIANCVGVIIGIVLNIKAEKKIL